MPSDYSLHLNMDGGQPQENSFLGFREKLVQNKKNVTAFCTLLVIASILLGSTVFFMDRGLATLVQLLGFMALGYLHVAILQGNLAILQPTEKLVYSLILALAVFVFVSAFYFFADNYSLLVVSAAICSFLLPYVLSELWRLYNSISETNVSPWYYSRDLSLYHSSVYSDSIPLRFKVQIEQHGRVEYPIAYKAMEKMKLGTIFYHMIKAHNESGKTQVDFIDRNRQPFGWVFFTPSFAGWSKSLDPEATLIENNIRPNAVIIARRIPEQILPKVSNRQSQTA